MLGESEWMYDGVIHLVMLIFDLIKVLLCGVFELVCDSLFSGVFWVVGVSGLGGAFGCCENGTILFMGVGLVGLFKSVVVEWLDVRICVVDLNV